MKLKELEDWLDVLLRINVDLNIAFNNAKYLREDKENEEEKKITNHGFFRHHLFQLTFIISVQLCKVFDDRNSQKFNFFRLRTKLMNESLDDAFIEKLNNHDSIIKNQEQLIILLNSLYDEVMLNTEEINRVKKIRDKYYAHRDPDISGLNLSWNDIEKLIILSRNIYNFFNEKLYDKHMDFERTGAWSVKDIIRSFALFKTKFNERINKNNH